MNKIYLIYRKIRVLSQLPLEFFPSLTPPVMSDTNMRTKGNFYYSIPSPLTSLCSQLVHMVEVGNDLMSQNLPQPILQNSIKNNINNNIIITSKVLLLTWWWGVFSA